MPVQPKGTDTVPDYVVLISSRKPDGRSDVFLGSGVLIAADLVLTCRHVCWIDSLCRFRQLKINLQGEGKPQPAAVLCEDAHSDLAVLRLKHPIPHISPPQWAQHALVENDKLRAVGF